MKPSRRNDPRILVLALGASLLLLGSACSNPFVARHKVLVDSIAAPGVTKPAGQSYRLVAKKSVIGHVQAQVQVVKACIDAALATHGMYEPPANVAPDIIIEVGYGVDASVKVDPSARETFLQLSARANPSRALDRATGPELWDVRVAVLGISSRLENAMPLLATVAADYIATDTKFETKIEVPQNSPAIKLVRESAIKSLESKAATTTPPPPAPPAAPNGGGGGQAAGIAPSGR